ncbi:MAG TPA: Calx-beta domain-containing protein [Pyrinomonadaceae bacterium]|nr:Calx-beta domain-containing protein [Pyrinomonadaceae bacterium]
MAGKVGQAFLVDSADDAVTSASINIGSAYTVDLWIRPATSNTADFQRVLGNTFNGTNFGTIYLVQNRIEYYQNGSNSLRVSSASGSVPFNTYTHVALTYDGSVSRLYINGTLAGTSSSHTEFYNNAVRIGYAFDSGGNSFFGQLDEVEIFNRALAQSEINAIVAADTAGKCKPVIPAPTPTPPLAPNPSPSPIPSPAISCAADLTFDTSGKTTTDFQGGIDGATAVAVQSDGKILVAGRAGSDFALARLNSDGTMDASFGTGGRVYTDFFLGFDSAETMLIQPDGKIVVAGSTVFDTYKDFALVRYNPDGSLDTGFGIGGKVTTDFNKGEDAAYGIALQSDGRIVAAGGTGGTSFSSADFGLARYNTNGSLDTTFGDGGRLVTDLGNDSEQANGVAIQTDGKIVVSGYTVINNIDSNFALTRYNTNGTLDTAFDTDGKVTTDFGSTDTSQAVAIQTDGKIVAAGRGAGGAGGLSGFAVARYNTNGGLDPTFDGDGKITIATSGNVDTAEAVVIQPDGKIVAAGWGGDGSSGLDFVAIRYTTTGAPDPTFDGDGKAATPFFNGDFAYAAALQADGKIVLAGSINNGSVSGTPGAGTSSDFALLRYNTNGSLDSTFDGDGKLSLELFNNDENIVGLGLQSTGKIIAAGGYGGIVFIFDAQNHNFQLARYNTNGQLDTSFGTAGRVSTDFVNGSVDIPTAIAVLPDDRIVVAGTSRPETSGLSDLILARYSPDGALDSTFDGDGKVITDFSSGSDGANAMLIQPDGKIVIGGFAGSASAFVRYNANGTLDNTFGTGGRAVITPALSVQSIALQQDGKIVAAGYTGGTGSDFAITRYNSNGSRDDGTGSDSTPGDSFGVNGSVTTDFTGPSGFDIAYAVRIQTDGKIVVAGDISLARYNTNGTLDPSFDGDGKATTIVSLRALAIQTDGKLMGAGMTGGSAFTQSTAARDFALVRFNTDGTLDTTMCTGGAVTSDFFGSTDLAYSIIIQPDGKPVLGGVTYAGGSTDFALARYNTTSVTPDVSVSVSPSATTEDGAFEEGATELIPLTYRFARSGSTASPLTVNFSVGGTAIFNSDYSQTGASTFTASSGTVIIAAGASSAAVTIAPTFDNLVESNETVILTVTSATGYNAGSPSSATGTILNDDPTPNLSINDVQIAEGNSGTINAVFTVTLSAPSSFAVTVNFATVDGTATQPSDYQSTTGLLTFNPGDVSEPISVPVNGDTDGEASETFFVNLSNPANATIADNQGQGTILNDDIPVLNFSLANYTVSESGGFAQITVVRTGDPVPAVNVDYLTTDNSNPADFVLCSSNPVGTASSRCDFNTALGTLNFLTGETSKTFNVLITQDSYVEGMESLLLSLSNPTNGATVGNLSSSTLQIIDDSPESTTNPILDARNFVRQQYHDFLNREPDQPGWDYWTDNITRCNEPARRPAGQTVDQCIDKQRETTSAAFFLSPEFQYTGLYVYSVYKGSLGRMPNFLELMRDVQQVSRGIVVGNSLSGTIIEQNRAQYETEFINRADFVSIYVLLDNQGYVDKLFQTTGVTVSAADKQALVNGLNGAMETRATVLHKVTNGTRVIAEGQVDIIAAYGKAFSDSQFTPAFVQMEYLGYLRRNSDAAGFIFWRDKMNSFGGDFLKAEMVKSFLMSPEYLQRFAAP